MKSKNELGVLLSGCFYSKSDIVSIDYTMYTYNDFHAVTPTLLFPADSIAFN